MYFFQSPNCSRRESAQTRVEAVVIKQKDLCFGSKVVIFKKKTR